MRKSVIISIVYPPTTPAFSHPSFPEGGEWRYHRLIKLPPNLKKNPKQLWIINQYGINILQNRTYSKRINKKRYHDSRRSTVTTQTQNKTRQNYYAISLSIPGRYKYYPCIFTYSQTASGRLASIKQIACTICFYFVYIFMFLQQIIKYILLNTSFTKFQLPVPCRT